MLKRRLGKHRSTSSSSNVVVPTITTTTPNTTTSTNTNNNEATMHRNTSWDGDSNNSNSNTNSNSNATTKSGNYSSTSAGKSKSSAYNNSNASSSVHTSTNDLRSSNNNNNNSTGTTIGSSHEIVEHQNQQHDDKGVPQQLQLLRQEQQQEQQLHSLTMNNRRYPNGCLKKTSIATSTSTLEAIVIKATTNGGSTNNRPIKLLQKSMSMSHCEILSDDINHTATTNNNIITTTSINHSNKKVHFQDVYIREFERILGDNPSCSSGAPISLGWNYAMDKSLPIDLYEERQSLIRRRPSNHGSSSYSSRGAGGDYGGDQLILSRHERETLLMEWGITFQEMIDVIRTNVKIKNQRRRTVNAIGTYDRIEEMMENTAQKLKRKLKLQKSDSTTTFNGTNTNTSSTNKKGTKDKKKQDGIPNGTGHSVRSYGSSDDSGNSSSLATSSNGGGGGGGRNINNGSRTYSNSTVSGNGDSVLYSEANDYSTDIRTPASSTVVTPIGVVSSVSSSSLNTNNTKNTSTTVGECIGKGETGGSTNIVTDTSNINSGPYPTILASTNKVVPPESALNIPISSTSSNKKNEYSDSFAVPLSSIPPKGQQFEVDISTPTETTIPRRLLLQRYPSVESGITMEHFPALDVDDDTTVDNRINDSLSTMHFLETEHSRTTTYTATEEETDVILEFQEVTITENDDNEDDDDLNETDDDMTMPSKFLHEFGEFMASEFHPNQLLTSPKKMNNIANDEVFVGVQKPPPLQRSSIRVSEPILADPPFHVVSTQRFQPIHREQYRPTHEEMNCAPRTPVADFSMNTINELAYLTPKSSMTELDYHREIAVVYDEPLSPISEFTGGGLYSSNSSAATFVNPPEDGNFDTLVRDSSFWQMRPGVHDAPQIQRTTSAVIITEEVSLSDTTPKPNGSSRVNPKVLSRSKSSNTTKINDSPDFLHNVQMDNIHIRNSNLPHLPYPDGQNNPMTNFLYQQHVDSNDLIQQQLYTAPLPTLKGSNHHHIISTDFVYHEQLQRGPVNILHSVDNEQYHQPAPHLPYEPNGYSNVVYPNVTTPQYNFNIGKSDSSSPTSHERRSTHSDAIYPEPITYIEPEIMMYNIVDGQPLHTQIYHHPAYNVQQNINYDKIDSKNHNTSSDHRRPQHLSSSTTQQWEEHGFRVEPPPNSSVLLNKMMS